MSNELSYNDRRRAERLQAIKDNPPRYKKEWPRIEKDLVKRLRQGHYEYGDDSFERPVTSLLGEAREEILDQMLWSFIAVCKLDELIAKMKEEE